MKKCQKINFWFFNIFLKNVYFCYFSLILAINYDY